MTTVKAPSGHYAKATFQSLAKVSVIPVLAFAISACGPESERPIDPQNPSIPAPSYADETRDLTIYKEFNNPITTVQPITEQQSPLSYSLGGDDAEYFSINTTTGGLYFEPPNGSEQGQTHYSVVVSAADRYGQKADKHINIEIIDNYTLKVLSPRSGSNIGLGESAPAPFTLQLEYVDIIGTALDQISITVDGIALEPVDDKGRYWYGLIDVAPGDHAFEVELNSGARDPVVKEIEIRNRPAITGSYSNFTYNEQTNQIVIPDDRALNFYGVDLDSGEIGILNALPDSIGDLSLDSSYFHNLTYVPWAELYYATIGGSLFVFDGDLEPYSEIKIEEGAVDYILFDLFVDVISERIFVGGIGADETAIYEIDGQTQDVINKYELDMDRPDSYRFANPFFTLDLDLNRAFITAGTEAIVYMADLESGESHPLLDLSEDHVYAISKPLFHQDSGSLYVVVNKGGLSSLLNVNPDTQEYTVVSGYDLASSPYVNTVQVADGPVMLKAASPYLHPHDGSLLLRSRNGILSVDLESGDRSPLYVESLSDGNVTPGTSLLLGPNDLYVMGGTNRSMQKINLNDLSDTEYLDFHHGIGHESRLDPIRSRSVPAQSRSLMLMEYNYLYVLEGDTERSHLINVDTLGAFNEDELPFSYQTDFTFFNYLVFLTNESRDGLVALSTEAVPYVRDFVSVDLEGDETLLSLTSSEDALYMIAVSNENRQYRLIQLGRDENQTTLHELGFDDLPISEKNLRISYMPETDSLYFLGGKEGFATYDLTSQELSYKPISQGVSSGPIWDIAMDPSEQFYWLLGEGGHLYHFKDGISVMAAN